MCLRPAPTLSPFIVLTQESSHLSGTWSVVLTHITSLPGHWQTMSPPLIRYFHIFLHNKGKYRIHQNEESNLASRVIDECFQATGSTNHRLVDKGSQWNHHLYYMFTLLWQYVATIVTKCYTAEICRQKWGHIVNRINLDLTHRDELSQPQIVLTYTKHGLLGIANKKNYLLYVYIILLWPYFDSKVTKIPYKWWSNCLPVSRNWLLVCVSWLQVAR